MPRELLWRAVATAIFLAAFVWSLANGHAVIAGIVGFLCVANMAFLAIGVLAWRRGLVEGHS